jgi:hypothetical protein
VALSAYFAFFYHYVQFIVTAAMLVGGESHRIYFLTGMSQGSFRPNFVHICPVMSEKIFEKLIDKSKIFRQFCCTMKISFLLQTMQQLEKNFLFCVVGIQNNNNNNTSALNEDQP